MSKDARIALGEITFFWLLVVKTWYLFFPVFPEFSIFRPRTPNTWSTKPCWFHYQTINFFLRPSRHGVQQTAACNILDAPARLPFDSCGTAQKVSPTIGAAWVIIVWARTRFVFEMWFFEKKRTSYGMVIFDSIFFMEKVVFLKSQRWLGIEVAGVWTPKPMLLKHPPFEHVTSAALLLEIGFSWHFGHILGQKIANYKLPNHLWFLTLWFLANKPAYKLL